MEKVKITEERERYILSLKEGNTDSQIIQCAVDAKKDNAKDLPFAYQFALKELGVEGVSLVLNGWYEVEEDVKEGDFCVVPILDSQGVVLWKHGVLKEFRKDKVEVEYINEDCEIDTIVMRKAHIKRKLYDNEIEELKEKIKWASIGRKVNEYHHKDVVFDKVSGVYGIVMNKSDYGLNLIKTKNDAFPFAVLFSNVKLICPVEHRFDYK